jgi:superfamily II DNA or RNA helicase/HKD family nuclease
MARAIDNDERTMLDALSNALETSDSIDIFVGYFYFSGFQLLAEKLKDKKIRILVGMTIDPSRIEEMIKHAEAQDHDLSYFAPNIYPTAQTALKDNYMKSLIAFVNNSESFDSKQSSSTFDMFLSKIADGSLEIRQTSTKQHSKFYIVHNKTGFDHNGDFPGTTFMGSNNFTYKGLIGQGEMAESFKDSDKFLEYKQRFEKFWDKSNSLSIAEKENSQEFIAEVKRQVCFYQQPSPYEMYIRVLHELYKPSDSAGSIETPSQITSGGFLDFEYQTDAVKIALDRIEKFDGVIIADVVGLGKSIIASAVATNLDMNTVIISPPHLIPQWEDYKELFRIRGSKVFSSGKLSEVYERYSNSSVPLLIVIDEAHRFRNEDTMDYRLLHQICRSNPRNKVILLTATPFNNSPQDVFALMKLFQTPGQSTIRSIDNLSLRFRDLISKYKKLRTDLRKSPKDDFSKESNEIALEVRKFLEPVVIRRSRLDLGYISRYRKDLERQKISFPKIEGPKLLEYDLGKLIDLYLDTLNQIGDSESENGFLGARYKPATYVLKKDEFRRKYGDLVDDLDLTTAQTNLADFMRKLLVMRLESSKFAFKTTLERMIANNILITSWWNSLRVVPIMKKGQLPDPVDFSEQDGNIADDLEIRLEHLRSQKGLIEIPIEWIDPKFIEDVQHDTEVLQRIYCAWFEDPKFSDVDPKLDEVERHIRYLLEENPSRKIVVFSAFADSVSYLSNQLILRGLRGVFSYTASESNAENRRILLSNFDASYALGSQSDDYQILVCTDALSEGVNLHRAGVVVNYDIPYNPTRVIQRIGRINRINKKVFDSIQILNFFPTYVGDNEIRIKAISTLKMGLINNIVGSDMAVLTPDENLETFFKNELAKADNGEESLSWDSVFIEDYETAIIDKDLLRRVEEIPRRTRISRKGTEETRGVILCKNNQNAIFVTSTLDAIPEIINTEDALRLFKAEKEEEGSETSSQFTQLFDFAKDKLLERHPLPEIRGRRKDALEKIEAVRIAIPSAESYCADLETIIREFDDVSEGTLKDIAQARGNSPEEILVKIKASVPETFISNVFHRVERMKQDVEIILLAEELNL